MRIGITGHQRLRGALGWEWVDRELRRILAQWCPSCVGLTSLAVGADQHFAEIVVELGGALEVIVPFRGYENRFKNEKERAAYGRYLRVAHAVLTLSRSGNNDDELCYLAAGQRIVDRSDLILAVWDGKPAAGVGGTADVVAYADSRGRRVVWLNPVSRKIEQLDLNKITRLGS